MSSAAMPFGRRPTSPWVWDWRLPDGSPYRYLRLKFHSIQTSEAAVMAAIRILPHSGKSLE
jgi:hypothetical protein